MKIRRLFAILLALCLVVSMVPGTALPVLAAEHGTIDSAFVNPVYQDVLDVEDLPKLEISRPEPGMVIRPTGLVGVSEAIKQIREGLEAREADIPVTFYTLNDPNVEAQNVFFAALEHTGNPTEGDYLNWQVAGAKISGDIYQTGNRYDLYITYHVTYLTTAEQEAEMDTAVDALLDELDLYEASTYSKLKGIYDYICENVTYDYDNLEDETYTLKYTAYAALVNKTAVCQGYATLLYRLALELGVDCRIVAGYQTSTGGGHAWNIAEINGKYYNLDTTWDAGYPDYWFFLVSNEDCVDHTRFEEYDDTTFNGRYPMGETSYDPYPSGIAGADAIWRYNAETLELSFTGTGAIDYFEEKPWADRIEEMQTVTVGEGISEVSNELLRNNETITEVKLPSSLKRIGDRAFSGCAALERVELPEGLEAIGASAFSSCKSLTSIEIPDSVVELGATAFAGSGLTQIVFPGSISVIPNAVCRNCYDLVSVTVSSGVTELGSECFNGCNKLTSVTVPETLKTIGDYAFAECSALESIGTLEGLESIGENAFLRCRSLREVKFSYGLQSIGAGAFSSCESLSSAGLPDSVTEIGNGAFSGTGLTEFVLPEGITVFPEGVCSYCPELVSVTIPSGVTELGRACLSDCEKLTSVTLPETLEIIGDSAFYGSPIKELRIPAAVREIGLFAFYAYHADEGLQNVYFTGNAPEIGRRAFENVKCNVYYPQGDETWTEEVMQQYEGTLTWIPYVCEVASGTWGDNLTWSLNSTGVLTISGEGEMQTDEATAYSWYEYHDEIKQVVIEEGVTTVADYAFYYSYPNLEKVVIGQSVTSLGAHAFSTNSNLKDVQLPGTLKTIDADCFLMSGIESITLPEGLETIGAEAFMSTKLTQIVIPDTVTSVGTDAFSECANLTSAVLSAGCQTLPMGMFRNCTALETVTIPEGVTAISWSVFKGCTALQNVTLPESLVSMGAECFADCTSLNSMVIPAGVTEFVRVFVGCSGLETLYFMGDAPVPEGMTTLLDDAAFEGVTATVYYPGNNETWTEEVMQQYEGTLTWIAYASGVCGDDLTWTLLDGVLTISGTGQMYDMTDDTHAANSWHPYSDQVQKVIIEDGATSIGRWGFRLHANLEEVVIPDTVTAIGEAAFGWCTSLKSLEIPVGVTKLDSFVAHGCESLTELILPEGLETIVRDAFGNCTSLTKVEFPSTLKTLEFSSFAGCTALREIWFTGDAPEYLDMVFDEVTATVYYPGPNETWTKEQIEAYKQVCPPTLTWEAYWPNPFTDVSEDRYYYKPVLWAYYNGITSGKTATTFEPNATCTRAQVMTFLWAAAGRPEPTSTENPFTDVSATAYYYKAVLWAVENGITSGTTATTFSPNASCTRNQVVTFLWVNAGRPEPTIENPFADVEEGKYYYKAVLWAYENGITTGRTPTTFEPHGPCTRGQIVTFLYQALAEK